VGADETADVVVRDGHSVDETASDTLHSVESTIAQPNSDDPTLAFPPQRTLQQERESLRRRKRAKETETAVENMRAQLRDLGILKDNTNTSTSEAAATVDVSAVDGVPPDTGTDEGEGCTGKRDESKFGRLRTSRSIKKVVTRETNSPTASTTQAATPPQAPAVSANLAEVLSGDRVAVAVVSNQVLQQSPSPQHSQFARPLSTVTPPIGEEAWRQSLQQLHDLQAQLCQLRASMSMSIDGVPPLEMAHSMQAFDERTAW